MGKWFDQFEWLHYDEGEDKAYCYSCMEANSRNLIGSKKLEPTFISEGYKNWKDAPSRFGKHQQSECHREGVMRLHLASNPQDVGSSLSKQSMDEKAKARTALLKLLSNIKFLARQGLPFRGAGDDSNSNFYQLNLLRVEDDAEFDNWLKKKQLKYDSPEIQNEMINIMAQQIVRDLSNQIRTSKFFAILADETTDSSNREQLVICLRWLEEKFNVHEDMVGFYQIDDTGAETIAASIKDALIRLNISISKCRGQTYDGASAMSGRKSGVQARLKQQQPKALYNHCHGHMINLVCAENIKTSKCVSDSLDTALEITKLVKKSPQRDTRLEKIRQTSVGEQGDSPGPNICMLCPTRWTVRADAMDSILKNYDNLMELWDWSLDHFQDAKMKARIRDVQTHMTKFDFYFGLSLGESLLRNADNLSAAIQKREISVAESYCLAMKTVTTISKIRTDDSFDLFWNLVTKKAEDKAVEEPKLPRQRRMPARFEMGTADAEFQSEVKAYYRQIYFQSTDHVVNAINDRYDSPDFKIYMQAEQLIMKCVKSQDYETEYEAVTNFYGDDFHKENLKCQLCSLAATFEVPGKIEDLVLADVVKYFTDLSARKRQWLAEVQTLLQLILIMPATNATSERSFSGLRRIKTYLRSTMKQERLNSLMILHVQKERIDNLRLNQVAAEFAAKGQRASIFGHFAI